MQTNSYYLEPMRTSQNITLTIKFTHNVKDICKDNELQLQQPITMTQHLPTRKHGQARDQWRASPASMTRQAPVGGGGHIYFMNHKELFTTVQATTYPLVACPLPLPSNTNLQTMQTCKTNNGHIPNRYSIQRCIKNHVGFACHQQPKLGHECYRIYIILFITEVWFLIFR